MTYQAPQKAAFIAKMLPPHNTSLRQLSQKEGISEGTLPALAFAVLVKVFAAWFHFKERVFVPGQGAAAASRARRWPAEFSDRSLCTFGLEPNRTGLYRNLRA